MAEILQDILKTFCNMCEKEKPLIWLATVDGDVPHLAPVCFVKSKDNKLLVANVFVSKTVTNINKGSKIAAGVVFDKNRRDGYLVKGKGTVLDKGQVFEEFYEEVIEKTGGKRIPRSVILITVEKFYSLKPFSGKKRIL